MSHMTAELQRWLNEQIERGCTADSMIAAMVKVGHIQAFAAQAVEQAFAARAVQPRAAGMPAAVAAGDGGARGALPSAAANDDGSVIGRLRQAEVRAHIMNAPNWVDADFRRVHVLFAMAQPRVVLFGDLLSGDECELLIDLARPKLARSTVVDRATGAFVNDDARTSEGTHFERGENPLVARIEQRVAALTGIPVENQEPLQILHYGVGGEYEPHYDYFVPDAHGEALQLQRGGQRIATLVMYLNDVPAGGATLFPKVGIETKPRRGCGVYFENLDDGGAVNPLTLHAGAPVGRGEKWIATKWIREGPFA
jgi:prolyl 4-hydroxylase